MSASAGLFSRLRGKFRATRGSADTVEGAPRREQAKPFAQPENQEAQLDANPLGANIRAQKAYARALARLGGRREADAIAEIAKITAWRPGLVPDGDLAAQHDSLSLAAERLPENLSVRTALAEAKRFRGETETARDLFVSVIRQARPVDRLGNSTISGDLFRDPGLQGHRFQSVDLGNDFVEGTKAASHSAREMLMLHWPDLRGKTVLDVGSYAGWFAFEADRRGAAKVTANDYYSWMVNYPAMWAWYGEQQAAGIAADTYNAPYPAFDREGQPGRALFDLTRQALGSTVIPLFGPIETVDVEPHDIVLLLGVLYHSPNPFGLLKRMFELTREVLIVETLAVEYSHIPSEPIWYFWSRLDDMNHDATTIWSPSAAGLVDSLLKAGFSRVELLYGWSYCKSRPDQVGTDYRLFAHAYK